MSNETGSNQNESSANDAVAGSRSPFCSLALSEPTPHISAMDVDEIMLEHFGLEHEKRKMEAINAAIDRGDLAIDGEVLTDSLDVVSTYRGGYEAVIDGPFIHFSGSSPRVESAGPKDRTSQNLWVHFSHLQRTLNPYAGSAGRLPPINCLSSTSKSSEPHSGQDSLESLKLLAIVCPFVIEEGSVLRQDGKRYRIATDVEVSVSWSSKAGVQANDQGNVPGGPKEKTVTDEKANQHEPMQNEEGGSRSGSPASYPSLRPAEFANTIEELEASLADWHKQKYLRLEVDVAATQRKLLEEVGELIEAVQRRDRDAVRLEAADVLFVMCHLVRAVSAGPDSGLQPAIDAKLAIIWRRLREDQQKAVWSRV